MEFFGIGPLELFFILIIALIVLGPKDMAKAGRTIGSTLRKIVTSDTWASIQDTRRSLRYLPNKLMRDAGLEEDLKKINQEFQIADITRIEPDLSTIKPVGSAQGYQDIDESELDFSDWITPPDPHNPVTDLPTSPFPPPDPPPNPDSTKD